MPILFRASLCMGTNEGMKGEKIKINKKKETKLKKRKEEKKKRDGVKTAILYIHWIAFLNPLDLGSNNHRLSVLFNYAFLRLLQGSQLSMGKRKPTYQRSRL